MCLQSKLAIGIKPKQINMYLSSSYLLLFDENSVLGNGAVVIVGDGAEWLGDGGIPVARWLGDDG